MKRKLLFLVVFAVAVIAGCDPFGTSETRAYITAEFRRLPDDGPLRGGDVGGWMEPGQHRDAHHLRRDQRQRVFMLEVPFFTIVHPKRNERYGMSGAAMCGLKAYALANCTLTGHSTSRPSSSQPRQPGESGTSPTTSFL